MILTKQRIEELDSKLAAFPFSLLQDFLTFGIHCERFGIDMDEIPAFLRHHVGDVARVQNKQRRETIKVLMENSPRCQVCNSIMMLEPINDQENRMVDDHSMSWWVCPDPDCGCDPIMSDKYPFEILTDLGVPVHRVIKQPQTGAQTRKRARSATQRRCGEKRG